MKEKANKQGISNNYLEPDNYEDDDDGAISINAIKGKYKNKKEGMHYDFKIFIFYSLSC